MRSGADGDVVIRFIVERDAEHDVCIRVGTKIERQGGEVLDIDLEARACPLRE